MYVYICKNIEMIFLEIFISRNIYVLKCPQLRQCRDFERPYHYSFLKIQHNTKNAMLICSVRANDVKGYCISDTALSNDNDNDYVFIAI